MCVNTWSRSQPLPCISVGLWWALLCLPEQEAQGRSSDSKCRCLMESTGCREGSGFMKYSQSVLAKFCTEPGQGWVWGSHRFSWLWSLNWAGVYFLSTEQILVQAPDTEAAEENGGASIWLCPGTVFGLCFVRVCLSSAGQSEAPAPGWECQGLVCPGGLDQLDSPCPLPKSLVVVVGSQAEATVSINITKVCSVRSETFLWWVFSLLLVCFKPFVPPLV